jgi:hypothetical protein
LELLLTIVHSSTIQLSLSGLPQSSISRLTISQQLRRHCNRCSLGNRRTPGSLLSVDTNSPTQLSNNSNNSEDSPNSLNQLNSEVYDLWSDCRGDSAFGIGCLAITRETGTLRPRAARYRVTSTPWRARHSIMREHDS